MTVISMILPVKLNIICFDIKVKISDSTDFNSKSILKNKEMYTIKTRGLIHPMCLMRSIYENSTAF